MVLAACVFLTCLDVGLAKKAMLAWLPSPRVDAASAFVLTHQLPSFLSFHPGSTGREGLSSVTTSLSERMGRTLASCSLGLAKRLVLTRSTPALCAGCSLCLR